MVRKGHFACTVLPRLEYIYRLSNRWIIEQEEHEWELAPDAPHDDTWPEEAAEPPQHEVLEQIYVPPQAVWYELVPLAHYAWIAPASPAHDAWIAPVAPAQDAWYASAPPAPDASGFAPTAVNYQPGEGSSSQWGNEGASS
jgi:hypothetical protein